MSIAAWQLPASPLMLRLHKPKLVLAREPGSTAKNVSFCPELSHYILFPSPSF